MKRTIIIIIISILFLVLCGAALYYYYFMPNNQVVAAFEEGQTNLVIEGDVIVSKNQPKIMDEEILLPIDTIKKYFDPNIYWDDNLKKVTITTKDRVIRMKTDSLNALINNKPVTLTIPVTIENNVVYIPIEFLSEFYGIEINYLKTENVVVIDYVNGIRQLAEPITPDAVVRKGRSIRFPIIKRFDVNSTNSNDQQLRVFEEYEKWYKVRANDGSVGYIEKKYIVVKKVLINKLPEEAVRNTAWKPGKGRINLAWELMYGERPDLSKIDKIEGLDIVSPTWFHIRDGKGTISNSADLKYVEWAHKNGYKVWALLNNDIEKPITQMVLKNTDVRDNIIRQILALAALYKLDGINIDLENIYEEDKDDFTQFVREATPFFREQGLVVSVDINELPCYDREALGAVVDYVMLMAYDQHWRTSPVAGSVAQITWVENILNKYLKVIPREKLLLGLPFYSRVWEEKSGSDGKVEVSSKSLTMEEESKIIKENNARVTWDKESGQFYAEYKKDNSTYKIWVEDKNSIDLKSALIQKYRLAGAAAWKRDDEVPEIWDVLNKNLKVLSNYQEWTEKNKNKEYYYEN